MKNTAIRKFKHMTIREKMVMKTLYYKNKEFRNIIRLSNPCIII